MRKIVFILYLFFAILEVNATCDLSVYNEYVDLVSFDFEQLEESETFKIYASNISGGISLESGRWLSRDGFLDYITYGNVKYVNVFVSDGTECSGEVLFVIKLSIDESLYFMDDIDEVDYQEIDLYEVEEYSKDEIDVGVIYDIESTTEEVVDSFEVPIINQNVEIENDDTDNFSIKNIVVLSIIVICFLIILVKKREKVWKRL